LLSATKLEISKVLQIIFSMADTSQAEPREACRQEHLCCHLSVHSFIPAIGNTKQEATRRRNQTTTPFKANTIRTTSAFSTTACSHLCFLLNTVPTTKSPNLGIYFDIQRDFFPETTSIMTK
jgi:hypothetical protein